MIDKQLIQRIKKRERNAFRELYESSFAYTYSIVRRYINSEADHTDVVQDIYARVFLKIDTYDVEKGEFKFWLRRIAINQSLTHYRAQKRTVKVVDIDNVSDIDVADNDTLKGLSESEMDALLKDMPDGYRQVFMLISIEEYSHKEVSKMLGIDVQTTRSQLSRAKSWLRKNQDQFSQLKNIR